MENIFDWKFYVNYYPDLLKNGIDDKEKAWKHWIEYGKNENRIFSSENLIQEDFSYSILENKINIAKSLYFHRDDNYNKINKI